jgi:hypothetical protein
VLGGFSLLTAGLSALTVIPRVANGYLSWTVLAVSLIVVAFLGALVAVGVTYSETYKSEKKWWRDTVKIPIALAATLLMGGIAIMLVISLLVLGRSEVPRLTLSIAPYGDNAKGDPTTTATVKLKIEADAMNPGGYLVANIVALDTIVEGGQFQVGQRIYRSLVGSDSAGHVMSEIETQIPIDRYSIVVAEVFPGPVQSAGAGGAQFTWSSEFAMVSTTVCTDIEAPQPRACVYARVPGSVIKFTAPSQSLPPTPIPAIVRPRTGG